MRRRKGANATKQTKSHYTGTAIQVWGIPHLLTSTVTLAMIPNSPSVPVKGKDPAQHVLPHILTSTVTSVMIPNSPSVPMKRLNLASSAHQVPNTSQATFSFHISSIASPLSSPRQ